MFLASFLWLDSMMICCVKAKRNLNNLRSELANSKLEKNTIVYNERLIAALLPEVYKWTTKFTLLIAHQLNVIEPILFLACIFNSSNYFMKFIFDIPENSIDNVLLYCY